MNEQTFNRIEAYLMDQMNPDERARFQADRQDDHALDQAVREQEQLILAVETEGVRRTLAEIAAEEAHVAAPKAKQRRMWRPLLIGAAAAVALLIAGRYFFRPDASSELFAAYYTPAPGLPTTLGATDEPRFAEGMVAYKLGEYEEARAQWLPLADNDTLNYYLGISYLAATAPDSALFYLRQVADNPASAYREEARWYVALAHLQARQPERARTALKELDPEHPNREQIKALLKEIPRNQ
ncbi:MAG: hypothetical protein WBA12_06335 [Catalinimonas sp.]